MYIGVLDIFRYFCKLKYKINIMIVPNNNLQLHDLKQKLNKRLTTIVERENSNLSNNAKSVLDSLCNFILFFERVKNAFFETLIISLLDKLDSFYNELSIKNKEKTDKPDYDFNRAFDFLKIVGKERASQILNTAYPNSSKNKEILEAIICDDYNKFLAELPKERHEMLSVLSEMQYVICGHLNTVSPLGEGVSEKNLDKIFKASLWTKKVSYTNCLTMRRRIRH